MPPDQLRTEAEWLARRSCFDRADYLFEVAHSRGPEVADQLHELVCDLLSQRFAGRQAAS